MLLIGFAFRNTCPGNRIMKGCLAIICRTAHEKLIKSTTVDLGVLI